MITIKRLALAAVSVAIIVTTAVAHDYAEFAPLDPELRSFLVTLLEDANAADHLEGEPDMFSAGPTTLSARLTLIIDAANDADMRWLESTDYKALEHPVLGRVPAGLVLQLFSDLADAVAHAEEHADTASDVALAADLARLKTLSEKQWGQ